MRVFIHAGHLSVDNGAVCPLNLYFQLAKMLQISPDVGQHYGFDSLEIEPEDWPIVEELLNDSSMLYRIDGQHPTWQNVRTDVVRRVLARH